MRSLQDAVGRELRWKPRSLLSRTHDLVDPEASDGEPYATLLWRPGFLTGGLADAQSGDGRWTFREQGLLRRTVLVTAQDEAAPLATLRRHWRRAVLRFEDGRQFVWRRESFWSRVRCFEDGDGAAVVRLRTRFSFPRSTAQVEIEASSTPATDRALLACLGWYDVLVSRRRGAAHGAG